MPIFPDTQLNPPRGIITPNGYGQPLGTRGGLFQSIAGAAAWPAVNRAIYMPFIVETTCTLTQICIYVGAAAGNIDVGVYNFAKTRLVSFGAGGTATAGANALQLINVTDTVLTPGNYWFGAVCSTTTTLTLFRLVPNVFLVEIFGVQQEALGATTLPATATFANPAVGYIPVIAGLVDLAA